MILCSGVSPWATWATEKRDRCQLHDFMYYYVSKISLYTNKRFCAFIRDVTVISAQNHHSHFGDMVVYV